MQSTLSFTLIRRSTYLLPLQDIFAVFMVRRVSLTRDFWVMSIWQVQWSSMNNWLKTLHKNNQNQIIQKMFEKTKMWTHFCLGLDMQGVFLWKKITENHRSVGARACCSTFNPIFSLQGLPLQNSKPCC